MISCTEFIPAYSELFKYLEEVGGRQAVEDFWCTISDEYLGNLRSEVERNGLRGCFNYWAAALNEEAADFTMTLDEEKGEFTIAMHYCPSMGKLVNTPHLEPYHDYCRHCDVLYRRIVEPLGYSYDIDMTECHQARCSLTIRDNTKKGQEPREES